MANKKLVYVDIDDVLSDYTGAYAAQIQLNPGIHYPQSQYGFFAGLKPIEGAVDAMYAIAGSQRYEPYILTAPSIRNPLPYTEKRVWVEEKLGMCFVDRLIICSDKGLLRGDFLIDDNEQGKGQNRFEGELLRFGGDQFPSWSSVLRYLAVF